MTSQEEQQQRRQPAQHDGQGVPGDGGGAVRYGDVFAFRGELARTPIAPQDAAMMQAAENAVLGQAPRGRGRRRHAVRGQAQRAPRRRAPRRGHRRGRGGRGLVNVASVPGCRVVTEFVDDQPVGQYVAAEEEEEDTSGGATATAARQGGGHGVVDGTKITIGEALEATVFSAGDQPVAASDAAAEAGATGLDEAPPGGLAAQARAAADANARAEREADKTTLRQVLADATLRLGADKEVEREDAARVVGAEVRSDPEATARPGGVGASIAAAARLNRGRQ